MLKFILGEVDEGIIEFLFIYQGDLDQIEMSKLFLNIVAVYLHIRCIDLQFHYFFNEVNHADEGDAP